MMHELRSEFVVYDVTDEGVWIIDTANATGKMSVTNDAEQVTRHLYEEYGSKRFFYCDTDGRWDELGHVRGEFQHFIPGGDPQ